MITPVSTDSLASAPRRFLITGPSGIGKTSTVPTASKFCPPWISSVVSQPPADAKPVVLSDIAILAFDSGGGSCFPARKVSIPHYYDFAQVAPSMITQEVEQVVKHLVGLAAKGDLSHVFLDTATAFDGSLQARHSAKEKTAYFNAILSDHVKVFSLLKTLECGLTVFAQPKAVFDMNDDAKEKREIKGLPGAHAKITGDALERYRADSDFRFWVERGKKIVDGKPAECVFWVTSDPERDCKDRVYGNLPAKIEADYRVLAARPVVQTAF